MCAVDVDGVQLLASASGGPDVRVHLWDPTTGERIAARHGSGTPPLGSVYTTLRSPDYAIPARSTPSVPSNMLVVRSWSLRAATGRCAYGTRSPPHGSWRPPSATWRGLGGGLVRGTTCRRPRPRAAGPHLQTAVLTSEAADRSAESSGNQEVAARRTKGQATCQAPILTLTPTAAAAGAWFSRIVAQATRGRRSHHQSQQRPSICHQGPSRTQQGCRPHCGPAAPSRSAKPELE